MRTMPLEAGLLSLCVAAAHAAPAPGAARVFVGGRIWTGEAGQPWAEALAVRDGILLAVGAATSVRALADAQVLPTVRNGADTHRALDVGCPRGL